MSTPPPSSERLDRDTSDTIRLSVAEATALGTRALRSLGFPDDEVRIIVEHLIDNALCGYPCASLPRILAIAQDAKTQQPRQPVRVVHDTPVSACSMGGTTLGMLPCTVPRRSPLTRHVHSTLPWWGCITATTAGATPTTWKCSPTPG